MKNRILLVLLSLLVLGVGIIAVRLQCVVEERTVTIRFGDRTIKKTAEDVERLAERLRQSEEQFDKALSEWKSQRTR